MGSSLGRVAMLLVALVSAIASGGGMVALNLAGHVAEPAVTALFTGSSAVLLVLLGAAYAHNGNGG